MARADAFARIGDLPSAAALRVLFPCARKVPHRSRGAAEAHLRALRRNPLVQKGDALRAYHCHHCGLYHVGHLWPDQLSKG